MKRSKKTTQKSTDWQSVAELFSEQTRKNPDAVALCDGPKTYTYKELDEHTNRISRFIRSYDIGPEKIVGCYLSSSSEVAIFCISILKTGGAYLLLDPNLPDERLQFMMDDAEPSLIITDTWLNERFQKMPVTLLTSQINMDSQLLSTRSLSQAPDQNQLAYIAYTSGSTGRPKGVLITHGAIANHSVHFSQEFSLDESDVIPLMAPIAFDMATEEMIPPLMSGCKLIAAKSNYESMEEFTEEITTCGYTILNIPAPLWHEWVNYLTETKTQIPVSLRLIIAGSDKIHTRSFLQWQKLPGSEKVRWVAAYGTTETAVTSTFYLTAADDDLSDEPNIPIGKAIANTTTYILNEHHEPVAAGEVGELYIGGAGLARGYHKLPQKTLDNFIDNPFSDNPNDKLYKTGDLARERADGNIVCLGRKDFQIKIRGLRIELGEIETMLEQFPVISSAIVALHQPKQHEASKRLIAYITTSDGTEPPIDKILDWLRDKLHRYMIPHQLVWLPQMPLNNNGKIDRKLLNDHQNPYMKITQKDRQYA